jgi:hypothetical protein
MVALSVIVVLPLARTHAPENNRTSFTRDENSVEEHGSSLRERGRWECIARRERFEPAPRGGFEQSYDDDVMGSRPSRG